MVAAAGVAAGQRQLRAGTMVVESSLDQQRTGYLVKVSLMYVMLMVDLAANSIADHTPASDGVGPLAWAG